MSITTILDRAAIAECYLPGGEAERNTDYPIAKAELDYHYNTRGVARVGTFVALVAPAAPTIAEIKNITGSSAIIVITPGTRTETLKIYKNTVLVEAGVATFEYTLTGLAANTSYSITAKGTNVTGDSAVSEAVSFTTTTADSATAVSLLLSATVAVVVVTGTPKIVGSGTAKIYDARIIGNANSQATSDYYWKDIVENNGKSVLPEDA